MPTELSQLALCIQLFSLFYFWATGAVDKKTTINQYISQMLKNIHYAPGATAFRFNEFCEPFPEIQVALLQEGKFFTNRLDNKCASCRASFKPGAE